MHKKWRKKMERKELKRKYEALKKELEDLWRSL